MVLLAVQAHACGTEDADFYVGPLLGALGPRGLSNVGSFSRRCWCWDVGRPVFLQSDCLGSKVGEDSDNRKCLQGMAVKNGVLIFWAH